MRVTLHQYSFHYFPSFILPSPHLAFLTALPPTAFIIHHRHCFILTVYLPSLPLPLQHISPHTSHPSSRFDPSHSYTFSSFFISSLHLSLSPDCPQHHTLPSLPLCYIFFQFVNFLPLNQNTLVPLHIPLSQFIHSSSSVLSMVSKKQKWCQSRYLYCLSTTCPVSISQTALNMFSLHLVLYYELFLDTAGLSQI